MTSARGDRKPCTHAECSGTMQFSREPLLRTSPAMRAEGDPGWVCSEVPEHFALASARPRPEAAASIAPQARWDDDGGPTADERPTDSRL